MSPTPPTPADVVLSDHALARYHTRVKPQLDADTAAAELQNMKTAGEIVDAPPPYAAAATDRIHYLLVGDVALPLKQTEDGRWIATTALISETISPKVRQQRNARRRSDAAQRRADRGQRAS